MPEFFAGDTLPFEVPNGHPFYADPAAVFSKSTGTGTFAHPASSPAFEKQSTSAIEHPCTNWHLTKSATLSPVIARQRHVVG